MSAAGLFMLAGGNALNAYSAYQGAAAQKASLQMQAAIERNNAILADYQADDALYRGHLSESRYFRQAGREKGTARATVAASGVEMDFGSPVALFAGMDAVAAQDLYQIERSAAMEEWGYRSEAAMRRTQAGLYETSASAISPGLAAATSLLSGAGQTAMAAGRR